MLNFNINLPGLVLFTERYECFALLPSRYFFQVHCKEQINLFYIVVQHFLYFFSHRSELELELELEPEPGKNGTALQQNDLNPQQCLAEQVCPREYSFALWTGRNAE